MHLENKKKMNDKSKQTFIIELEFQVVKLDVDILMQIIRRLSINSIITPLYIF